jgi:hypothetical protein
LAEGLDFFPQLAILLLKLIEAREDCRKSLAGLRPGWRREK